MTGQLGDLVVVIAIAGLAGAIGIALGIVILAPRIARAIDRDQQDEGDGDGHD